MTNHKVVSRDQWLKARTALLADEKQFTRQRDDLARRRRELPWVKVEKNYVFDTLAGKKTLAELFDGRSQLIVYHFMFAPNWVEGCRSCSFLADGFDGATPHLNAHDVTFTAISRAPLKDFEPFKRRMGWRFPWASSFGSDFNSDYHVSFTPEQIAAGNAEYNFARNGFPIEEGPGLSAFYKDEKGDVYHTYSTYARGLDPLVTTYHFLDLAPKGRDEDGLAFSMAWVRHHDQYGPGYAVDPKAGYVEPKSIADEGCPACAGTAAAAGARS